MPNFLRPFALPAALACFMFTAGCSGPDDNEIEDAGAASSENAAAPKAPSATPPTAATSVPHNASMREYLDEMDKLVAIFRSVTDEASAKAVAPKLRAQNEKLEAIGEQWADADAMTKSAAHSGPHGSLDQRAAGNGARDEPPEPAAAASRAARRKCAAARHAVIARHVQ